MDGFNPQRLRIARRRRGMVACRLATAVGVTPQSITDFENGAIPCEATLARIAKALDFPVEFFRGPDLREIAKGGASFRSLKRMTAKQSHAVLAAASFALELSSWIDSMFNLPQPNVPDLRGLTPEAAAIAIRARWMIGADSPFPNVIHVMERNGIRVFSLPDDYVEVDGFSCWVDDTPFVFLNTLKSGERGRFDAAHELGHLVLHRHSTPRGPAVEKEANDFASALLMPADAMLRDAPRIPTADALMRYKSVWCVSIASLVYRLHKLGLITDRQYRAVMIEVSKRGWRTSEPFGIPRESSQVLQKVLVALREDGIRRDDIAKTLRLSVGDLDAVVFGLVPTNARGVQVEAPAAPPIPPGATRGLRLVK